MLAPCVVFLSSFVAAMIVLLLERSIGIGWDFHPDAAYYSLMGSEFEVSLISVINNLYALVAWMVVGEVEWLIAINIVLYCVTNVLGYNYISRQCKGSLGRATSLILLGVFLIQPYRVHLAVHALKDTLIIILLCLVVIGGRRAIAYLFLLLVSRVAAIIYVIPLVSRRMLLLVVALVVSCFFVLDDYVFEALLSRNEIDMGGRDFDTIPRFSEYGLVGSVLRAVLWPMFIFTGVFAVFAPALAFIPIAAEIAAGRIALLRVSGSFRVLGVVFLACACIGLVVNSFTAFVRYCYPLICVMPLLVCGSGDKYGSRAMGGAGAVRVC